MRSLKSLATHRLHGGCPTGHCSDHIQTYQAELPSALLLPRAGASARALLLALSPPVPSGSRREAARSSWTLPLRLKPCCAAPRPPLLAPSPPPAQIEPLSRLLPSYSSRALPSPPRGAGDPKLLPLPPARPRGCWAETLQPPLSWRPGRCWRRLSLCGVSRVLRRRAGGGRPWRAWRSPRRPRER